MSALKFSHDEFGHELLLKGRHQVMMEWEKPYMEACIDALQISSKDDVLEVGFGCGYASNRIQHRHPKSHTIIECDKEVLKKAKEWAKGKSNVKIVEDTWQNALKKLGKFDVVFFDDYPLQSDEEIEALQDQRKNAMRMLDAGRKKMLELEKKIPFIKTLVYTNKDLEEFFQMIKKDRPEGKMLYRFLIDLEYRGQITKTQCEHAIDRLLKEKYITPDLLQEQKKTYKPSFDDVHVPGDRMFFFLEECLKHHMKKGARFSCYISNPQSKYQDDNFSTKIIANPYLDYAEKLIAVDVPPNCDYYKGNQALVITITKMS